MAADKNLKILVCGKVGVGKSSLMNSLIGWEICDVGVDFESGKTRILENIDMRGIKISFYDSPGLRECENIKEAKFAESNLESMYDKCRDVDLFFYCVEMTSPRITKDDLATIRHITKSFGKFFWGRCVLVLTKANKVVNVNPQLTRHYQYHKNIYSKHLEAFQKALQEAEVPEKIISAIPACAAGRCCENETKEDRYIWYASANQTESGNRVDFLKELLHVSSDRIREAGSREKFLAYRDIRIKVEDYNQEAREQKEKKEKERKEKEAKERQEKEAKEQQEKEAKERKEKERKEKEAKEQRDKEQAEKGKKKAKAAAVTAGGAAAGAAIGLPLGPVGVAAGAVIGGGVALLAKLW